MSYGKEEDLFCLGHAMKYGLTAPLGSRVSAWRAIRPIPIAKCTVNIGGIGESEHDRETS